MNWDSIIGLERAKDVFQAEIVFPMKRPELFRGDRQPLTSTLLYGPSGNDSLWLARTAAGEAGVGLMTANAADWMQRDWHDGRRHVRRLFELARRNAPAIIFIDELDTIDRYRTLLRSYRKELFLQMDAISGAESPTAALHLIGATSCPWEQRARTLKRFQTRLYIPLPGVPERAKILKQSIGATAPRAMKDKDYHTVSAEMDGLSDEQVACAIRQALMRPISKIRRATHYKLVNAAGEVKFTPCSPKDAGAMELSWSRVPENKLLEPPLQRDDFLEVVSKFPQGDLHSRNKWFTEWTRMYGQEGA